MAWGVIQAEYGTAARAQTNQWSRFPIPDSRFPMTPVLDQFRLLHPGPRDFLEIVIVACVLYRVLLLIQGRRAVQMLIGIVVLVLVYAVAWVTKLTMITYLLELVFTYGAFAALIIFQPELRVGLAHLGPIPDDTILPAHGRSRGQRKR